MWSRKTDDTVRGNRGLGLPGRLALVAAGVIVIIGAAALVGPRQVFQHLPWSSPDACPKTTVDITVAPELAGPVQQLLDPLNGAGLPGATCLQVALHAQASREIVESAGILPADRAPQIWIADSTLWGGEVKNWQLHKVTELASTPVVVATSQSAAAQLGWDKKAPTWQQAMRNSRPFAVPDLQTQTEALESLIALWQTMGKNAAADSAVVGTVLAADRTEIPEPDQALAVARSGSVNAPLLPATEQQIAAANAGNPQSKLIAVYPTEGSPVLDYPVYTTSTASTSAAVTRAVELISGKLTSASVGPVVRAAGFRDVNGTPGAGIGVAKAFKQLAAPSDSEVDGMLTRVDQLARPSKLLLLLDVNQSMKGKLSDGIPKTLLAQGALRLGASQLPDRSAVGVWLYSSKLGPTGADYKVLSAPANLGVSEQNGETHRQHLLDLDSDVDPYISRTDTRATWNSLLYAARYMRRHYNSQDVSAIILMTDGADNASYGVSYDNLIKELKNAAQSPQKVEVFIGSLGPNPDFKKFQEIAKITSGYAYQINTAYEGQQALLDGLRRSRHIGGAGS